MTKPRSIRRCAGRWSTVPLSFALCAAGGAADREYPFDAYIFPVPVVDSRTIVAWQAESAIAAQGDEALAWIRADWRIARLAPPAYTPG